MKTINFIGGGRITKIILQALQNAKVSLDNVTVYDVSEDALRAVKAKFPQINTTNSVEELSSSDLVILSVHPPMVMEAIEKLKGSLQRGSALVSLAPKFTIEKLTSLLGGFANIARMNPSASAIVNKGVNPVSFSSSFDTEKKKAILDLFQPLGYSPVVDDSKIEAYAVVVIMTYYRI